MQLDSQLQARRQQKLAQKMSYDFGDRKTFMVPPPSERTSVHDLLLFWATLTWPYQFSLA